MTEYNIPIAKTQLTSDEISSVLEPLKSGWLVQGPKVGEFEEKWCQFTNAKHSIAVTSCTSALHLSLEALDFGEGDEAIVPAFTWISTANVVEHLRGKVVFCDIDLNTFNLDVSKIEELITPSTKVIIPVHLFGLPANMEPILSIAKAHNLKVVEDAACGFGSQYRGRHVGLFGDTGCFSFHPRKSITTGEGGMITTENDELAKKLRCLRDHGAELSDLQRHVGPRPYLLADHPLAGYNQRMTDIQGVLGSTQMDRAGKILEERRQLASNYNDAFVTLEWLRTPTPTPDLIHGYQSYPCLFAPQKIDLKSVADINLKRNSWMEKLQSIGISTRPATHAVHMLSYYKNKYGLKPSDYPNSYIANDCSVSFPLYNGMTSSEQNFVIDAISGATF
ncbi:MAG: aminotransferase DegT [Proteobacteria bacterium]|nr:aminotransferase DegT [Pseudomonadota bacterium]